MRNNEENSNNITGFYSKKKYYIKIRTYKTAEGEKYYSGWSKTTSVKTK